MSHFLRNYLRGSNSSNNISSETESAAAETSPTPTMDSDSDDVIWIGGDNGNGGTQVVENTQRNEHTGRYGIRAFIGHYIFMRRQQQNEVMESNEEKYYPISPESSADVGIDDHHDNNENVIIHNEIMTTESGSNERLLQLENDLKVYKAENETLLILVEDLVKLQESHQLQVEEVKKFYDKKIEELTASHEIMVEDLIASNEQQVQDFISSHEGLIQDLINSHDQQIREWRLAFLTESEGIEELKDNKSLVGIPAKIWFKFEGLSETTQGLVVIGIGILGAVVGLSSWRFIFWAWPKLISFAASIEAADVISVISWLNIFTRSPAYSKFIEAWKSGEPVTPGMIKDFGADVLGFGITNLAPALLNQRKSKRGAQTRNNNAALSQNLGVEKMEIGEERAAQFC